MLHMAIKWFLGSSLFGSPRSSQALAQNAVRIDSNSSVRDIVAADLSTKDNNRAIRTKHAVLNSRFI